MGKRRRISPMAGHPSLIQAQFVYGRRRFGPAESLSRIPVVVRCFDDGAPLFAPSVNGHSRRSDEYDVAANNPSFDARIYEHSVSAVAPYTDPDTEQTEGYENDIAPTPGKTTEPGPLAKAPHTRRSFPRGAPETLPAASGLSQAPEVRGPRNFTAHELSTLVNDEDFKNDIATILGRAGRDTAPDARSAPTAVSEPRRPASQSQNRMPTAEEAAAALNAEGPGEHMIFDKIAQNMQFAKAYELAPVSLSKRFDAFDREGTERRPRASRQETVSQRSPSRSELSAPALVPAPDPIPAATAGASPITQGTPDQAGSEESEAAIDTKPAGVVSEPPGQSLRPYTQDELIAKFGDPRGDVASWAEQHLEEIELPQIDGLPGTDGGRIRFHKDGAQALRDMFAALEKGGALANIDGLRSAYSEALPHGEQSQSHIWGIAIDLDIAPESEEAISPATRTAPTATHVSEGLAQIARQHGFLVTQCGPDRPHSLHFELGHQL